MKAGQSNGLACALLHPIPCRPEIDQRGESGLCVTPLINKYILLLKKNNKKRYDMCKNANFIYFSQSKFKSNIEKVFDLQL